MDRKTDCSAPGPQGKFASPFWATASLSDLGPVTTLPRIGFLLRGLQDTWTGTFAASCTRPAGPARGLQAERPVPFRAGLRPPGPAALGAHPRQVTSRAQPPERLPAAPAQRSRSPRVTGPLTRACTVPMAPSPTAASQNCLGPTKVRLARAEGGTAVAELRISAPPTRTRTLRTGGVHDAPP